MKVAVRVAKFCVFIVISLFPQVVYCENNDSEFKPISYEYLMHAGPLEIEHMDVAVMNLACAEGLPGAENLDITYCLKLIDLWTDHARAKTVRQMPMFYNDPGDYYNSVAYFKILVMVTALELDIGVRYNLDLVKSGAMDDMKSTRFFHNSQDIFLHGILSDRLMGSCSSIPVLMVAVGRRLGYPLYLATSKGHLYAQWIDSKEKFNIETASRGLLVHPDSHYREWPFPITDTEIKTEGYLKPMSSMEELALFIGTRAICLTEHRRYKEALRAYEKAYSIRSSSTLLPLYINEIKSLIRKDQAKMEDK